MLEAAAVTNCFASERCFSDLSWRARSSASTTTLASSLPALRCENATSIDLLHKLRDHILRQIVRQTWARRGGGLMHVANPVAISSICALSSGVRSKSITGAAPIHLRSDRLNARSERVIAGKVILAFEHLGCGGKVHAQIPKPPSPPA